MTTLLEGLRTSVARCGDREAVAFGDARLTYAELGHQVEQLAATLSEEGVAAGARVVLVSGNSDRFVVALYAVMRLRAIAVPCNPANTAVEIAHLLDDSGVSHVLYSAAHEDAVLAAASAASGSVSAYALAGGCARPDVFALAAERPRTPPSDLPVPEDDALILYTSGTTGRPKGALFDHHRLVWAALSSSVTVGYRSHDRVLHVAPLYHAAALVCVLFPHVMTASTHVIRPGFDTADVVEHLERERISMLFCVPTMLKFILDSGLLAGRDLASWRICLYGAAPISPETVTGLLEALPGVDLMQMCGQTEGGPGGVYAMPEDVVARPDASGRHALANSECRVVDEDGNDVAPGGTGELLLRSGYLMKGYWNNPEATAETIRDGWLHTGDVFRVDADGYLTIVDRLKDMIISGGRNVYSVEVELAVSAHPSVTDVSVVGVPHPDYGESIVAVVAPGGETPTLGDVRSWCSDRLAAYKIPHHVVVLPIPRTVSGKVQKHLLRASVREQLEDVAG